MEKIKVLDTINFDTSIFYTSLDKASRLLLEAKSKFESEGWTSIHLKAEYVGYDGGTELVLKGMRLENDSEFNKRKAEHDKKLKAQERKLERERKKYEELKKKFENE